MALPANPPVVVPDSTNQWHPSPVESVEQIPGMRYITSLGPSIPLDGRPGHASVANLDDHGRLDYPPHLRQPDCPCVGYVREHLGDPLDTIQYWLYYHYNEKSYEGYGVHEGDWEMFQTVYSNLDEQREHPIAHAVAQHGGGRQAWAWEDVVEYRDGRLTVYTARGSQATFFRPVRGRDIADGKGKPLNIEWRALDQQPWKNWKGRYGNSLGIAKSPYGPIMHEEYGAPLGWMGALKQA